MGTIIHNAIVVTSWSKNIIENAHVEIKNNVTLSISEIIESNFNDYYSFLIAPDGSKEGWADSDFGDEMRDRVIEILDSYQYEDGSNSLKYVEIKYDECPAQVVRENSPLHDERKTK